MSGSGRPSFSEIEERVIAISAEQFAVARDRLGPQTRPIQDLGIDSLDLIEWMMEVEERFAITLPEVEQVADQVYKEVFTRKDFTLRDMAELVHLRWGSGAPKGAQKGLKERSSAVMVSFSQLGGRLEAEPAELYRPLGESEEGLRLFRRTTDGMPCVLVPGGRVEIGTEDPGAGDDEKPLHQVELSSFLIDREVVSTTAYCRFLNSIGGVGEEELAAWFLIREGERRRQHQVIEVSEEGWRPRSGTAEWPMILVSWFGANAYALWAHGQDWRTWKTSEVCFLPTEAQWEYAARGPAAARWPWGDRDPAEGEINAGRHARLHRYAGAASLPLCAVTESSGTSPFGIRQMAGNVWQWCRDWYDPAAYSSADEVDPVHVIETGVRSERGGSWVGPIGLARSSYRRGRAPQARGRCLGFRCVGAAPPETTAR